MIHETYELASYTELAQKSYSLYGVFFAHVTCRVFAQPWPWDAVLISPSQILIIFLHYVSTLYKITNDQAQWEYVKHEFT